MKIYSRAIYTLAVAAVIPTAAAQSRIVVENALGTDRTGEIVETDASAITAGFGRDFVISAPDGTEVEWQITHDGKLIFPADVKASSKTIYSLSKGIPAKVTPKVYGRQFPERSDDMAWENDRAAYRAYGPTLQRSGERAFGYDIWTKCVDTLVLEQRFFDHNHRHLSFHEDHGKGMDVYAVGPTLGGGTAALISEKGDIVYPYCYKEYEVLDNGPLRFTVRLVYNPLEVDADKNVVETRLISLDRGSWLNKTTVRYDRLSAPATVAPGIVVHRHNPAGYLFSDDGHVMSYADLTDNPDKGNGVIFVGAVMPEKADLTYTPLPQRAGDAIGHILARTPYSPGTDFTYYWGSAWSKGGMPDQTVWQKTLERFSENLRTPLKVTVE